MTVTRPICVLTNRRLPSWAKEGVARVAPSVRDIAGYVGAELIGSGGFGAVYRATDAAHGRDVAIKVLQGSLGEAERRRFDRERQTMGRLGAHPYIIPVYESGYTEAGEGYIVMELATGGSLRDRLQDAPIPWDESVKVMAAVADAIQAAHDNGVLHRDIKPDNILIDQFNNPKLSDFGIAAVASNQTATTSTTATLAHAAPELLEGKPSTPSIDIYALGSTLHALITGRAPFVRQEDNNAAAMIARVINEAPPDLRPYGVPDSVVRIVERALSKNPDHRQTTAAQLASELRSVNSGESGSTEPIPQNPNETQIAAAPMPDGPSTDRFGGSGNPVANPVAQAPPPGYGAPPPGYAPPGNNPPPNPPGLGFNAPDQRPAPPPGYGSPIPPQGPGQQLPSPPPGYANVPNQVPGGPTTLGGPPVNSSAPYSTGQSWDPPRDSVSKNGGSSGRLWLIAVAAVVLLAGGGLIALLASGGDDPDIGAGDPGTSSSSTASTGTTTVETTASTLSTPTTPSTTSAAGVNQPTVEVDCPSEIALNTNIVCSIFTTNAISGEWHLPAFLTAPEPIEIVPGEYEIFIEPTNPDAIGRTFTVSATVEDADGQTARTNHSFTVVGVLVEINCPETIPLNSSVVCDIISTNATEGEWDIPGFGSAPLEVVPGSNPIFIEPNDAGSVGQTYTITATVRDAEGESHVATSDFTVGPAGS